MDFNILTNLEKDYLDNKTKDNLGKLYLECLKATKIILNSYLKTKGINISIDRKEQVIEDATTRLIEMYLKRPEYKDVPFSSRLYHEIRFQLHNKKQQKIDKTTSTELTQEIEIPEYEIKEEVNYLKELEKHPLHKQITIILYRNSYYKRAILSIEKITGREWIRDNAVSLRKVFELTRK